MKICRTVPSSLSDARYLDKLYSQFRELGSEGLIECTLLMRIITMPVKAFLANHLVLPCLCHLAPPRGRHFASPMMIFSIGAYFKLELNFRY